MKYSTTQLEGIAAKLREMRLVEKKKQEHSKQEAVKLLAKEITALKKRGYTLDEISETLRSEGLDLATPTLRNYLQKLKHSKKNKSKPKSESKKRESPEPSFKGGGKYRA